MANISKKNMGARAEQAAEVTPSLEDRLQHARDLAHEHPAGDTEYGHVVGSSPVVSKTSVATKYEVVPVDLIDHNPFNARKIYRPERVNELAASIGANGQEIPGIATIREGRYVLAAGHYRLRAIKLLGLKTMSLMIYGGLSDRELYGHSYRENAEREGQSTLDNALSWKELLDQKVYSSETELAEATGISLPNINKTLRVLRLSESVLDIVMEDPCSFALTSLYELALYEAVGGTQTALAMVKLLATGEAGRKEIQEARARLETPRERKRKETSRQYRIQREGAQIGVFKVWDSGRVVFDVKFENDKDRESLVAEIKTRFGVSG